ncbi:MAG: LysM peptidoglycan-binding domain-containing protein [Anaerolineaceae bacterium]|nr:LysM peptidoglycan-binding domain-containing protein [Anaerolineaceae bacterium]
MVKTGVKQQWMWLVLLTGMWALWPRPVLLAQTEPTATPDADGFIYAIVQPNDSLWAIAARSGISLTELLNLNNLTESALIQPGDRLIIAIVAPPETATPEASPTTAATRPPPTPSNTPLPPPLTVICLVAFADENGNGEREPAEPLQAGVAFTVFTSAGVVANYVTDGLTEPYCVTELAPGNYQITRSVGRTETLTNSGNRTVVMNAGDQVMLGFGSLVGSTPAPTAVNTAVSPTPPAAIIGSEAAAPLVEDPAESPNSRARRPFFIGAGILIGLLLIGTAVFISRKRT